MNIPAAAAAAAATRRFLARSSREALRLVREGLGDDAVILSNRITPAGVEIIAVPLTAERAPAPPPLPLPPAPPAAFVSDVPAPTPVAGSDAVLQELLSMRGMLEEQFAGRSPGGQQPGDLLRGHLLRLLLGAGFSGRLARATLAQLPPGLAHAQGLTWLRETLSRSLPAIASDDALLDAGGVYALVGPTGVGKTTTTAKLAARCVMRFGAEKLALITTDSFRIGACEQLRIYGRILGVPVHAVKDSTDLHLVLDDLRDKHMVLIDTVGMSQRDRAVADQIAMLCDARRPVRRLLVLNATSHGDTLEEVVHAYSGQDLAGCILTKTDEATHPGAVIDTVIRHALPLHYVSAGQKVPEHLELPQPAQLVEALFRTRSRTALFVPGELDVQEQLAPLCNEEDLAQAQSITQRLQAQCRQLVRALAHDAGEVASHAGALATAGIGFERVQALWRELGGDAPAAQAPLQLAGECTGRVLAACGAESALLLSDRSGQVLGAVPRAGLPRQDFGLPTVLLLDAIPTDAPALPWVARAAARTRVVRADGTAGPLAVVAGGLALGPTQPVRWRGQAARQAFAQARVALPAGAMPLRLVVERITEARTGKLLAQRYLLASATLQAEASQLLQWQAWRAAAQPCFRVVRDVQRNLAAAGLGEAQPTASARVAQAVTTAWRLQHSDAPWAPGMRDLLAQLAGRQVRAGRGVAATALFEGMGRLCALLEALAAGAAVQPAPLEIAGCV